jgi:membrane-bound ClpP family serine protease
MDRRRTEFALCLVIGALLAHPAWSQDEQVQPDNSAPAARLIRVPVPIVGSVDTRVKQAITRLVDQWSAATERPILVLEFWPPEDEAAGAGTEFARALSLAQFLTSSKIERVRTVAYLPRTIRGHAVLPVIACEEIIMHPDALLGEAGLDETVISMTVRQGYQEIANRRRTVPPPVALGMLDPQLKVYKAATAGGTRYVNEAQLEALQKETNVQSLDTIVAVGDLGNFTGNDARKVHGFASHLAVDRRELAAALELAIDDLDWDPSLGGQWQAMWADVQGPINDLIVNRVQRGINEFVGSERANLIWVYIDSPGGSPTASLRLANYLSGLDSSKVRTIAYVAGEARADAAIIALSCDHLIMSTEATLGGEGMHIPNAEEIADLRAAIREIANDKARRWSLPVALIDPEIVVHRYTLEGTNVAEYFSAEELAEQQDPQRWHQGPEQTTPNETLVVRGVDAEKLGLARDVVDNDEELKQLYQLETDPVALDPNWVDNLVEVLASPQVAGLLLFVAGFALIGEISSPGLGVAGFISAVCFVIYFWSQSLNQTAGLLEILLFLTGVACVVAEIFLIPGVGVFGFGGGLLILTSLILATQTFVIPRNDYQLQQLSYSFAMVLATMAGMGVGMFILRKYIDAAPILKHVLLNPPTGDELEERQQREAIVDFSHLLNCQGTTTTPIAPSGKARFGKEIVDVISDGEFLSQNAHVKVVDVQGNRVLIEPV